MSYSNFKRRKHKSPYSKEYIEERRSELYRMLADCKTEEEKLHLIKAFDVTINP